MTITPVITLGLNNLVLALTPEERWRAATRFNSYFLGERWFILTALAAVIVLTLVLLAVSLYRRKGRQTPSDQSFLDHAEKRGLSSRECRILLDVAGIAGLKRSSAIFAMEDAFDRAAAKMIEGSLARQEIEESEQLRNELSYLREKLGFQRQDAFSASSAVKLKRLSSRQIPLGRKVHMTRRKARDSDDIEATVTENNDVGLTVQTAMPVKVTFGELWRVRYYFGASVWEFDTSVISCVGDILLLNHGDNVRFINRRRFLRVPVNLPALVACFPFARAFPPDSGSSNGDSERQQDLSDASGKFWGPPEFVPGVVKELAGPGLLIEVPLEVKAGDRVLVVLRLDEGQNRGSVPPGKQATSKILEDIGQVKHTRAIKNGLSVAIELTGLGDSDVNELIRATNLASLTASAGSKSAPGPASAEEVAVGPVSARGAWNGR